jgi:hypothetical protein
LATAVAAGVARVRAQIGGVTATAELEVYVAADLANHPSGQTYWGRKNYVQYLPGTLPLILARFALHMRHHVEAGDGV